MTPKNARGAEIKNKLQKWPTLMHICVRRCFYFAFIVRNVTFCRNRNLRETRVGRGWQKLVLTGLNWLAETPSGKNRQILKWPKLFVFWLAIVSHVQMSSRCYWDLLCTLPHCFLVCDYLKCVCVLVIMLVICFSACKVACIVLYIYIYIYI